MPTSPSLRCRCAVPFGPTSPVRGESFLRLALKAHGDSRLPKQGRPKWDQLSGCIGHTSWTHRLCVLLRLRLRAWLCVLCGGVMWSGVVRCGMVWCGCVCACARERARVRGLVPCACMSICAKICVACCFHTSSPAHTFCWPGDGHRIRVACGCMCDACGQLASPALSACTRSGGGWKTRTTDIKIKLGPTNELLTLRLVWIWATCPKIGPKTVRRRVIESEFGWAEFCFARAGQPPHQTSNCPSPKP
jgi:hypothetical protein